MQGLGQERLEIVLVLRLTDRQVRYRPEKRYVVKTLMRHAIRPDDARTVHAEDDGKVGDRDVMDDLVEAAANSGMSRSDYIRRIISWALYGAMPKEVTE